MLRLRAGLVLDGGETHTFVRFVSILIPKHRLTSQPLDVWQQVRGGLGPITSCYEVTTDIKHLFLCL